MAEPKIYPSWRFNPTKEGRIVANAEEDAALKAEDDDWRETPYSPEEVATFTGRGVPGREVPELTVEPESIPGLQDPPGPEAWRPPVTEEAAPKSEEGEVQVQESVQGEAPEDETTDTPDDDAVVETELTDEQKTEIHETKATDLVESIATIEDADTLRRIRKAEKANPKGARKTVLDAVRKRLASL